MMMMKQGGFIVNQVINVHNNVHNYLIESIETVRFSNSFEQTV